MSEQRGTVVIDEVWFGHINDVSLHGGQIIVHCSTTQAGAYVRLTPGMAYAIYGDDAQLVGRGIYNGQAVTLQPGDIVTLDVGLDISDMVIGDKVTLP